MFSELRKADGTRYKGNTLKAINGALSSTGIFVKLEVSAVERYDAEWAMDRERLAPGNLRAANPEEDGLQGEEEAELWAMEREFHADAPPIEEEKPAKRKFSKKKDRRQRIINILAGLSDVYKTQPMERRAAYFSNPFMVKIGVFGHWKGITGLEDKEMLKQKMGEERFTLCMQLYAYFEDMFKLASGDVKFDMQHVINSGNEFDNKRLVYLRLDINDLRQRISTLEKIIGERANLQLCDVC